MVPKPLQVSTVQAMRIRRSRKTPIPLKWSASDLRNHNLNVVDTRWKTFLDVMRSVCLLMREGYKEPGQCKLGRPAPTPSSPQHHPLKKGTRKDNFVTESHLSEGGKLLRKSVFKFGSTMFWTNAKLSSRCEVTCIHAPLNLQTRMCSFRYGYGTLQWRDFKWIVN